jgi:hypothetical protein
MAKLEEAQAALDEYAEEWGSEEENTIDLMTDLLLLAHERGEDSEAILRMVTSNFEAEKDEETDSDEDVPRERVGFDSDFGE